MSKTQERLQNRIADRYSIERELGRGGMATVFLARDVRHDREVAIKVLHPELSASIGAERFEREIKLAAKLQHPHILGLYDSGEADGLLYYVMPFVKGESLRDRLEREGQLPIEDAVQVTLEVADALGHAHAQGIVHRDIKPENILLSGGHALVADFGIARAATEAGGQKLTQTGMAVGTPVYMAPEQAVGDTIGPTADLYSLGCVLYEMLAGEPPFTAKNPQALMARHAMEAVPSVRIVRNTVPEEVEDTIFAAMAKVPADRPQNASQFAELLGSPLGATAAMRATLRHTAARRVPTGTLAARQLERPRPIWRRAWVVALAGVLVFGGSLAAWKLTSRQRTPRSVGGLDAHKIAVLYFEDQSPDKKLSYVADGLTDELIDQLAAVRALDVVSKNGVAPFRGSDIPRDSIARVLGVGTLVEGALEPTRSGVRLTVRLVDGNSGADIKRGSFDLAAGAPLALRDSLAGRVAQFLRERLGEEITLRRRQAGTQNQEAWSLLQQAERLARDAALRGRSNDTAGTGDLLRGADSLLAGAERLDPQWGEAVVAGGELALSRAQATSIPVQEVRWVDSGFARANRALALDAKDPAALELRGALYYWRWFHRLAPDPKEAAGLLQRAETDLRQAVTLDPSRARAWYRLANVYFQKPDLAEGTLDIRRAYEEDAYLAEAEVILWRLYTTAYDNERFVDAVHWCDEGGRRFPANPLFVQCQLWLFTTSGREPNPAEAWRLLGRLKELTPSKQWPYQEREAQMLVAAALARAKLVDSARHVLERARAADAAIDPENELLTTEAVIRTLMGDRDEAFELLKKYFILHPEHRSGMAQTQSWWWRDLKADPRFKEMVGTGG